MIDAILTVLWSILLGAFTIACGIVLTGLIVYYWFVLGDKFRPR